MSDHEAEADHRAQSGPGEPTNEQIRDRIDELIRRALPSGDGGASVHDPVDQAELDQLWLLLRSRDVGPEAPGPL